jgi:DsbC/DsbD-like thiol-disulfide interchange protein
MSVAPHTGRPPALRPLLAALFALSAASVVDAAAEPSGAEMRIVSAGFRDGRPDVGLEIALTPGWKTYWRAPGDAGVPPEIGWSASRGVRSVTVGFPFPERFDEAGFASLGYTRTVILPLEVVATAPGQPIDLALDLRIGLCHDVCVPAEAHPTARLDPAAPVDPAIAARLAAARSQVPVAAGDATLADVVGLRRDAAKKPEAVTVEVRVPGAGLEALYVEGPSADWALPLPERIATAPGRESWRFALDGLPPAAKADGAALRFTFRADGRALERTLHLDAVPSAP